VKFSIIAYVLGRLVLLLGLTMLPSLGWAAWDEEIIAGAALLATVALCAVLGGALCLLGRGASPNLYQREALILVTFGWVIAGVLSSLPFVLSGALSPVGALFESFSGLTTCGASVIDDLDALPRSLLFWRCFTHWLGGIGIIVLYLVVLPALGTGGRMLLAFESSGAPSGSPINLRLRESVLLVTKVYCTLTVLQTAALMGIGGMGIYDALCHTFGTLATGGFSTQQASVAAYDSVAVECVIILFMIFGATSFSLHHRLWHGQWTAFLRDPEWRLFIGVLAIGVALCTANVMGWFGVAAREPEAAELGVGAARALRDAAFTVTSVMTNTGFVTADFDQWPYFSRMLLVILMFIGGCAGSTSGGIKVVRVYVLAKILYFRLENLFRPHLVRTVRLRGEVIREQAQKDVTTFFMAFLVTFAVGCLAMSAWGLSFESAASAVAACMTCTGPGLGIVGASESYSAVPAGGQITLVVLMVLGRLELLSALALLLPSFWRPGN
jgi:trk system potassium uptake protein TrkH